MPIGVIMLGNPCEGALLHVTRVCGGQSLSAAGGKVRCAQGKMCLGDSREPFASDWLCEKHFQPVSKK